jgi:beta-glucosidase
MKCEQAQHVIGDIKHYALNDQESGRNEVDSIIEKRAFRESDLLAFEIGVGIAQPGAVMCSYNAVNGDFGCENKYLLTEVLKKDWGFKGFVVSDWGGTHSTVKASAAGLDNEEPLDEFFGAKLKAAVEAGKVSTAELDDHVRRVLRSEFACGIVDHPTQKGVVDVEGNLATARKIEEQSAVLLKNADRLLPLNRATVKSIAVIGPHASEGMMSGGGSAQVDAPGRPSAGWQAQVWFPPSPA